MLKRTNDISIDQGLLVAHKRHEDQLLVNRLKIGCILAMIIVPAAAFMDIFVYPDLVIPFLIDRVVCVAMVGALLLALHRSSFARVHCHIAAFIWLFILLSYNSLMIYLADGVISSYYAGLNLCILGASLLLPWSFRECLAVCVTSFVLYGLACYFNWVENRESLQVAGWFPIFFNNLFIQLSNHIICLTAVYFAAKIRFRDFKLQFELDASKKELEQSYDKLEELDRAKSKFFANISHELRTPLTLIVTPLDRLRNDISITNSSPELKETVDIMFANSMRLLSLINDLLDLVRLEEGKFKLVLEPMDLGEFLPGLVSAVRETAEKNGLTIQAKCDRSSRLYVNADKAQLEKIFLNLLFNAIKFTKEGGAIDVTAVRDNGYITVKVQDSGIGIQEDKIALIFDRFYQDDEASTRVRQGTGIGLALVKELVEIHGGTVEISSEQGEGTVVTIRLGALDRLDKSKQSEPAEDAWLADLFRKAKLHQGAIPQSQDAPATWFAKDPGKYRLLVVEDEPDMRRFLKSELEETYNVVLASDGQMGLELAEKFQPHLILTDMTLPKLDGISLCRRVKASASLLPTKVILLTAHATDEVKISALKAGADEFITKPFSSIELKTRLANLLLNSQLERELQNQNMTLQNTLKKLKETEAQLVQTERLSALGNLSAGIMHEINNPVNYMLTAVHVLQHSIDEPNEDTLETIGDIKDGLQRISNIIKDLKGFAYDGGKCVKEECMANDIVQPVKRLLAHELKNDITLEEDVDPNVPIICNRNQMIQLMLNLIQNAIQASEENVSKGKERVVKIVMKPAGNSYVVKVRDNGPGIPKDDRAKVFDPFFTTKEVGTGMGLGLSICHTIVKSHEGKISVQSKIGKFTEFKIELPLNAVVDLYPEDQVRF